MLVKTPESADLLAALAPFTKDYPTHVRGARYYLCRGGACAQPVDSISELKTVLRSWAEPKP